MPKTDGRARKEVDWDRAEELCHIQCTELEIAADQGMCVDTFLTRLKEIGYSSFSEWFQEKRQPGLTSLRNKQYEVAIEGDKTMLIWLGKNWLDQTDKQKVEQKQVGPTKIIYEVADEDEED